MITRVGDATKATIFSEPDLTHGNAHVAAK